MQGWRKIPQDSEHYRMEQKKSTWGVETKKKQRRLNKILRRRQVNPFLKLF